MLVLHKRSRSSPPEQMDPSSNRSALGEEQRWVVQVQRENVYTKISSVNQTVEFSLTVSLYTGWSKHSLGLDLYSLDGPELPTYDEELPKEDNDWRIPKCPTSQSEMPC